MSVYYYLICTLYRDVLCPGLTVGQPCNNGSGTLHALNYIAARSCMSTGPFYRSIIQSSLQSMGYRRHPS